MFHSLHSMFTKNHTLILPFPLFSHLTSSHHVPKSHAPKESLNKWKRSAYLGHSNKRQPQGHSRESEEFRKTRITTTLGAKLPNPEPSHHEDNTNTSSSESGVEEASKYQDSSHNDWL